jgi:predicted small lipoprotein YifL
MRTLIVRTLIVLVMLNLLAACGTKTPLTLPVHAAMPARTKTAAVSPEPTFSAKDDSNKAAAGTAQ